MSIPEHVGNLVFGAVAGAGGIYFGRRSKRSFLIYVSSLVVLLAVLICVWHLVIALH
jgi:hypothetical protein